MIFEKEWRKNIQDQLKTLVTLKIGNNYDMRLNATFNTDKTLGLKVNLNRQQRNYSLNEPSVEDSRNNLNVSQISNHNQKYIRKNHHMSNSANNFFNNSKSKYLRKNFSISYSRNHMQKQLDSKNVTSYEHPSQASIQRMDEGLSPEISKIVLPVKTSKAKRKLLDCLTSTKIERNSWGIRYNTTNKNEAHLMSNSKNLILY